MKTSSAQWNFRTHDPNKTDVLPLPPRVHGVRVHSHFQNGHCGPKLLRQLYMKINNPNQYKFLLSFCDMIDAFRQNNWHLTKQFSSRIRNHRGLCFFSRCPHLAHVYYADFDNTICPPTNLDEQLVLWMENIGLYFVSGCKVQDHSTARLEIITAVLPKIQVF